MESKWTLAIALIAIVLGIFQILGRIKVPAVESFAALSSISELISLATAAGYAGLFVLMFLENLSLPIPTELFLPLAGYFAFVGELNFASALLVSTTAGLLGSLSIYFLAKKISPPLIYSIASKLGVTQATLAKSEVWLSGRYGTLLIFGSRFVPGIRSSISIPAGVLKMNTLRFALATLFGTLGWSLLLMTFGYVAGPVWQASGDFLVGEFENVLPYFVVVAAAAFVAIYAIRKPNG